MGGFQISIDELFEQLGLPESYRRIGNLKDRVIKPSLEEITANTDIDLSYENVKRGRSVVGFKFTVREKPKPKVIETGRDKNTIDMFCKLTDAQVQKYSSILSKVSDISDLSTFLITALSLSGFLISYVTLNPFEKKQQNGYLRHYEHIPISKIK